MNQLTVSLWGDEAFASILSQKGLLDIITIAARDTSPPLHYFFLHFWMMLFGTSEIAIRTFPMLLFVFLAFVVYKFAGEVYGKRAGVIAFFLTLFNPFLFVYAFEARMYMLLALTATASMWLYVTKRWRWYIVATTAALYTHHFSIFVIFVQVLYYLFTQIPTVKKQITAPEKLIVNQLKNPFIRSLLVVVLLYAPWVPVLYMQTKHVAGDFWLPKPSFDDLRFLFAHFIAGSTKIGVEKLILYTSFLLFFTRGFTRKKDFLIYLWLFFPAVLTYVMSQVGRPLFFDRYLIVSAPAIGLLLASQKVSAITSKLVIVLLTIVLGGLFFVNLYSFKHPAKQPFRDVANYVFTMYGENKEVINYYTSALHYFELKHYRVHVKVYSPDGPLPFWVGTALIDPHDVLVNLPKDNMLLVMASGNIDRIIIPGYSRLRYEKFKDLYLLWFLKN